MSTFAGLRSWWVLAALALLGLGGAAAGYVFVGGLVMAVGFAAALLIRAAFRTDHAHIGALHLRPRAVDLWLYSVLAVNVASATLLVTSEMSVLVPIVADVVLLMWAAVLIVLEARGGSAGATAAAPTARR